MTSTAIDMALPRILVGNISEMTIHGTGPIAEANAAVKSTMKNNSHNCHNGQEHQIPQTAFIVICVHRIHFISSAQ